MLPLDPSRDEIRRWGDAAVEWMADYLGSIREAPVYPRTTSPEIRARLDSALPEEGTPFENLLANFRDDIIPLSRPRSPICSLPP